MGLRDTVDISFACTIIYDDDDDCSSTSPYPSTLSIPLPNAVQILRRQVQNYNR